MKGDFSRGVSPDGKRGKQYRRVLPQQRTLLLDSDFAAMVDAADGQLRKVSTDLGYREGSPDLGYLITPGRLLAVFDRADRVSNGPDSSTITKRFYRDFRRSYLHRFPSLHVLAQVRIPLVEPVWVEGQTTLTLWCQADGPFGVVVKVENGPSGETVFEAGTDDWQAVPVTLNFTSRQLLTELLVSPYDPDAADDNPAPPIWIGLVELAQDAATGPHFWAAAGRFHQQGLVSELAAPTGYPAVSFPSPAPALDPDLVKWATTDRAQDQRIVAYLESWERDVTHVEDPGIREVALGGGQGAVRTQVMGQVKWAATTVALDKLVAKFGKIQRPGKLTINPDPGVTDPNPCALPIAGGYSGPDHRLYRFEVHQEGELGPTGAILKWSRDNASELFGMERLPGDRVAVVRDSGLVHGDLVEVLGDVIDLGDAARAQITDSGVKRARRKVGVLAYVDLRTDISDDLGRDVFRLTRLDAPDTPITWPTDLEGAQVLKLRRWHGRIPTTQPPAGRQSIDVRLEDGLTLTLEGRFEVGDYWQYEARRGGANDNGAWQSSPHGPERLLTPLAVLRPPAAAGGPAIVERWLDRRFPSLERVEADDIPFDGARLGHTATTVQAALERLIESLGVEANADVVMRPGADAGEQIAEILRRASFPDGGVIGLRPGVYEISTPVLITSKSVTLRGSPGCVIVHSASSAPFQVGVATGDAHPTLGLEDLILFSGTAGKASPLVQVGRQGSVHGRKATLVAPPLADGTGGIAIGSPNPELVVPDTDASDGGQSRTPATRSDMVKLQDCTIIARAGAVLDRVDVVSLVETTMEVGVAGVSLVMGSVEMSRSNIVTGRDLAHARQFEPDKLRERLSEVLADLRSVQPVHPATACALAVHQLSRAQLSGSGLLSRVAIYGVLLSNLRITDSVLNASGMGDSSYGLLALSASWVTVSSSRIYAHTGIHAPLNAARVRVAGCEFSCTTAVGLAGDATHTFSMVGVFEDVLIEDNDIGAQVAVVVGMRNTRPSTVKNIAVVRNRIATRASGNADAAAISIACKRPLEATGASRAIRIEGNDIEAEQCGISVTGTSASIRANSVRVIDRQSAMRALQGGRHSTVSIVDNVVVGAGDFLGIQADDNGEVRVHGNRVERVGGAVADDAHVIANGGHFALRVAANIFGARTVITSNDFGIGFVDVSDSETLHFDANVAYDLHVVGCGGGVISNNTFGRHPAIAAASHGRLVVANVAGAWRISGNASGHLLVQGSPPVKVATTTLTKLDVVATGNQTGSLVVRSKVLGLGNLIEVVGNQAALIKVITPNFSGANRSFLRRVIAHNSVTTVTSVSAPNPDVKPTQDDSTSVIASNANSTT